MSDWDKDGYQKCWDDAYLLSMVHNKSQIECYQEIVKQRKIKEQEGGLTMDRNKMTVRQEREFVNTWYDKYEKDFAKTFWTPYSDHNSRIGQGFEVVGRVLEDEADLECLPMWKIQFEDGEIIFAHPEEIVKSEIESVKGIAI